MEFTPFELSYFLLISYFMCVTLDKISHVITMIETENNAFVMAILVYKISVKNANVKMCPLD